MIIRISKIKVLYKHDKIKIKEHPYYLSLLNNNYSLYEKSISYQGRHQKGKNTSKFEGMLELVEKIEKNGFNLNLSPIKIESKTAHHGRHRICILMYLYGKNLEIKIRHGKIVKIFYENNKN